MKKFLFTVAMVVVSTANAALLELDTTQEFNDLISNAKVPVVVQFSAAWCGPCQQLKSVMKKVAPSYTDNQVLIVYVDADMNKPLKKYLQGGYPTTRTFMNGATSSDTFVGAKSESFVRSFLDGVVANDRANYCPVE